PSRSKVTRSVPLATVQPGRCKACCGTSGLRSNNASMNIPATRKHMVRCARRRSEHHAAPRQSSSRATQLNLATTSAQLWKTTRCTERVGGMINSARHLAQFNIARIRYPLDDQRMAEFVDNVTRVNGLADKIPGFVWRQQDESG